MINGFRIWGLEPIPNPQSNPHPHTRLKLITCRVCRDLASENEIKRKNI